MRTILYTGKGGVGKTTVCAATGIRCAELGKRTVVVSTDTAHSLSDSFDVELRNEPTKIMENLWAMEVNPIEELKKNWGAIQDYFMTFLRAQGVEGMEAEEFILFPGMEELFSLMRLKEFDESGRFDVVLVDCAPTAGTLQFLTFPDVVEWYMEHLFDIERKAAKVLRPVTKHISPIPLPEDSVFDSLEEVYEQVRAFASILKDSSKTTIRFVLNPEKMVIKETHRFYSYLSLYGLTVDAAIVNRVIPPEEAKEGYFSRWVELQQGYLKLIEESFSPLPLFKVKLFDSEMVGIEMLKRLAGELYGDVDPTRVLHTEPLFTVSSSNGAYTLRMHLPFATKERVELFQRGEELVVVVGTYKRIIALPTTLAGRRATKSTLKDGILDITFVEG